MVSCSKINIFSNANNGVYKTSFKSSNADNKKNHQVDNLKREKEITKIEILNDLASILLIVSLVANQKNIDLSKKLSKLQWLSVGSLVLCVVAYATSLIKSIQLNKSYNKEFKA